MEVYRAYRKKSRKSLQKIIFVYILCVLLRLFLYNFIGEIISVNPQYKEHVLFSTSNSSENFQKVQKVFVSKGFFLNRLTPNRISFESQDLQVGDVVLVPLVYAQDNISQLKKALRTTASIFTLGIIKHKQKRVFRKIVAVAGDTVVYNAKKILSINGPQAEYFENNDFPLIDETKEVTLHNNQIFLVGAEPYSLDDKIFKVHTVKEVNGRAWLLLGPRWGLVGSY